MNLSPALSLTLTSIDAHFGILAVPRVTVRARCFVVRVRVAVKIRCFVATGRHKGVRVMLRVRVS